MKKRVLTSGAMLAALLFAGANTSFAQTLSQGTSTAARSTARMHRTHWALSDSALSELASKLGLNAETLATEIKSGKSIQQALKDHGITEDQIKTAFGSVKPKDLRNFKLTDTEIAALASILNVNADQIKNDIAGGKTVEEILKEHNVTFEDIKKIFENKKIKKGNAFGKHKASSFMNLLPEMLTAESRVLSTTTDVLKTQIEQGTTVESLALAKGMTITQFHTNLITALQTMITNGEISGKQLGFYQGIIARLEKQTAAGK